MSVICFSFVNFVSYAAADHTPDHAVVLNPHGIRHDQEVVAHEASVLQLTPIDQMIPVILSCIYSVLL